MEDIANEVHTFGTATNLLENEEYEALRSV
jgi:hypothetical protein